MPNLLPLGVNEGGLADMKTSYLESLTSKRIFIISLWCSVSEFFQIPLLRWTLESNTFSEANRNVTPANKFPKLQKYFLKIFFVQHLKTRGVLIFILNISNLLKLYFLFKNGLFLWNHDLFLTQVSYDFVLTIDLVLFLILFRLFFWNYFEIKRIQTPVIR